MCQVRAGSVAPAGPPARASVCPSKRNMKVHAVGATPPALMSSGGPRAHSALTFAIRRTAVMPGAWSAKFAAWPLLLLDLPLPFGRPALQRTSRGPLRIPGLTRAASGIVAAMPWQRCTRLAVRQPRRACMPPFCMIVIVPAADTAFINGCMCCCNTITLKVMHLALCDTLDKTVPLADQMQD